MRVAPPLPHPPLFPPPFGPFGWARGREAAAPPSGQPFYVNTILGKRRKECLLACLLARRLLPCAQMSWCGMEGKKGRGGL